MQEIDIQVNRAKFIDLMNRFVQRPGKNELLAWLDTTDFYSSPASTKFHLNIPGGLCQHSMNVCNAIFHLWENWCMDSTMIDNISFKTPFNIVATMGSLRMDSLACVALLHDVCKANVYQPMIRNRKSYEQSDIDKALKKWDVKEDTLGKFVWVAEKSYTFDDNFPMGHGEKSVYLIMKYMELSDEEAMAIRWHMGFNGDFANDSNVSKAYNMNTLAYLLNAADMAATYLYENDEMGIADIKKYGGNSPC